MQKLKRGFEIMFIFACVAGLFTAVFIVAGSEAPGAGGYPYPYPPTEESCGGAYLGPYLGPYPSGYPIECMFLPAIFTDGVMHTPTPTATPTPTPTPTPTATPTATAVPYP